MSTPKDDLANRLKDNIEELHAHVAGLPEGDDRDWWEGQVRAVHMLLELMKRRAQRRGIIQPMSGGEPKTP